MILMGLLGAVLPQDPETASAVRSPEVHSDRRVTFRLRAPEAKQVFLNIDGVLSKAMVKGEEGVWSLTSKPLEPDIYPYHFSVDGKPQSDPANPLGKPVVMGGQQSMVHVPGPKSLTWERGDVPQGAVRRHVYQSGLVGEEREFFVYTPPGYDPQGEREYPVLYLLHGLTDDARAWTTAGRAQVILDNLIARQEARPMLMVNPLGYGFANAGEQVFEVFGDAQRQRDNMAVFTSMILEEIIPQVESAYRVSKDRESRAIAGLSMGGAQSLYIGINHRDRFAWAASFSGAMMMFAALGKEFDDSFPNWAPQADPPLKLLWVSCGRDDFLFQANLKYKEWLESKGVRFSWHETPGAHTWMVWRRNLTDLARLLFR